MSSKNRLCNVCGHWVSEDEDIVLLKNDLGVAHLECAYNTRKEE